MEKNNQSTKISTPLKVVLIFLILLSVIAIYILVSDFSAPHINDWKTYRSFVYNLRVQHPADWSVKECVFSNNDVIYLIPEGEPTPHCSYSMALQIPEPGFVLALRTSQFGILSSDTYQTALKYPYMNDSFGAKDFKRENVKVSSYEAIKASGTDINNDQRDFTNYVVNINNKPLLIYYSETPPTTRDYTDTADKIISTLKTII